jgi:hypothetical protein
MTQFLPTVLAAALLAAPAPEEKPTPPTGPTPTLATVAEVDQTAGTCLLRTTRVNQVTANRIVTENVNGMIVKKVVPETRLVTEVADDKVSVKDSTITDAAGNKIAEEDAWKRLTPGTTVVVSADGNKVDPAYLAPFKKETLVILPVRK